MTELILMTKLQAYAATHLPLGGYFLLTKRKRQSVSVHVICLHSKKRNRPI